MSGAPGESRQPPEAVNPNRGFMQWLGKNKRLSAGTLLVMAAAGGLAVILAFRGGDKSSLPATCPETVAVWEPTIEGAINDPRIAVTHDNKNYLKDSGQEGLFSQGTGHEELIEAYLLVTSAGNPNYTSDQGNGAFPLTDAERSQLANEVNQTNNDQHLGKSTIDPNDKSFSTQMLLGARFVNDILDGEARVNYGNLPDERAIAGDTLKKLGSYSPQLDEVYTALASDLNNYRPSSLDNQQGVINSRDRVLKALAQGQPVQGATDECTALGLQPAVAAKVDLARQELGGTISIDQSQFQYHG